jgi:hypothetical protein
MIGTDHGILLWQSNEKVWDGRCILHTCIRNRNPHSVLVSKDNLEYLVTDGRTTLQCVLMKQVGRARAECVCLSVSAVGRWCLSFSRSTLPHGVIPKVTHSNFYFLKIFQLHKNLQYSQIHALWQLLTALAIFVYHLTVLKLSGTSEYGCMHHF